MAAIERGDELANTMPPAYENIRDNIGNYVMSMPGVRGDLVSFNSGTGKWDLTPSGSTFAHGILVKPCPAGRVPEISKEGEMGGWIGLDPYTDLYPDAAIDGALSATKPSGGILQVRSTSETTIAYNFGP